MLNVIVMVALKSLLSLLNDKLNEIFFYTKTYYAELQKMNQQ